MEKKGVTLTQMALLQLIKQNKASGNPSAKYLEQHLSQDDIKFFEEKGLITTVKQKKNETIFHALRTTKEANTFLDNVELEGVGPDDIVLFEALKEVYLESGKELGNQKKTKQHIAAFRTHSNIDRNKLFILCRDFIDDEENFKYSIRLEYVFYKPSGAFDTKFNLDQSRLYQYYLKHQAYFDQQFEKIDEEEANS